MKSINSFICYLQQGYVFSVKIQEFNARQFLPALVLSAHVAVRDWTLWDALLTLLASSFSHMLCFDDTHLHDFGLDSNTSEDTETIM